MKTEADYFKEGIPIKTYMENMEHLKDESNAVYEAFELPNDGFSDTLKTSQVSFLVITEDWCGDAMMNNAIIRSMAESANITVHMSLRDADTDLIDRYLTNGGRAIPIVLILNKDLDVIGKWGPRAKAAQKLVDDMRENLPEKDDPHLQEKQKEGYGNLRKQFTEDKQLWLSVYHSLKESIEKAL